MLDRWTMPWVQKPLRRLAVVLEGWKVRPDQVTLAGFVVGMLALPLLAVEAYGWALLMIVLNRVGDGLDGALARQSGGASDAGGFLDIALDFIFYAAVVLGFALADSQRNALAAVVLLFSFIGTGTSFLAFAIMAARHDLQRPNFQRKAFYYLHGLTEGTETVMVFIAFCVWPQYFAIIAWCFAAACLLTTFTRVWGGYWTLGRIKASTQAHPENHNP